MSVSRSIMRPQIAVVVLTLAVFSAARSVTAQTLPTDAQATCTVTSSTFSTWFQSGTPSVNGVVNPANSLNFPDSPNCSFYQWAQQMFLWLTSPAPASYCGGGGHIFDSSAFFDVSPPDSSGKRTFISHTCSPLGGVIRSLGLRAAKVGPHGLPVIIDNTGQMREVETPPTGPSGRPLVFSPSGAAVEIQRLSIGASGEPIFRDKAGRVISGARPILRTPLSLTVSTNVLTVQKFMIGNRPVFLDPFGNVVEVEQGQAGTGGVLMAQTGSLIYYGIMVNDVYAYLLSGLDSNQISLTFPGQFPTTPNDLTQIVNFAQTHGVTFPDPNALAVEVKTAWVEASTLPNPSSYITMTATIPSYPTPAANPWTPNGSKTVQLALVGMHVVGSTGTNSSPIGPGHPEMIWATFEHIGNTPLGTYSYNSSSGRKTVNQNTSGAWLFSKSNSTGPFNCMLMEEQNGSVVLTTSNPPCPAASFSASDTLRDQPFGAQLGVSPNPIDGSDAASNTEILSINNSVNSIVNPHGLMPAGDVRNNYYLAGATWTIGGAPPGVGNQVGTSTLAGSTMETYTQPSNCLECHTSSGSAHGQAATDISHVFPVLQPLSFAQLSVRASELTLSNAATHRTAVTVTNSQTGAPVAGAAVTVSSRSGTKVSGTTSSAGTATLTYSRCFVVVVGGGNEQPIVRPLPSSLLTPARQPLANGGTVGKPIVITVPCDGSVQASGFPTVSFSAP